VDELDDWSGNLATTLAVLEPGAGPVAI
jgi:hypothetical protein